jgi:hypothetical protein
MTAGGNWTLLSTGGSNRRTHDGWSAGVFDGSAAAALAYSEGSQGGRLLFDAVMMFKILVLQTTNNLSDERTEFLINDRLSFKRSLDLGPSDRIPDPRTWSRALRMKAAIVNAKIERRGSFRRFAPMVLEEAVADWFEEDNAALHDAGVSDPGGEAELHSAVTHLDGSGRLQTVSRRTNPRYHRLIETFRGLTGVPMVLNTRSMRTSQWYVSRKKRSIASCGPGWTCW